MNRFLLCSFLAAFVLLHCFSARAQQLVPNTELRVKTATAISSRLNHKGDQILAFVVSPAEFQGATVEGHVRDARSSGSIGKTSRLGLTFETLVLGNQQRIPIKSQIKEMINSKGQARVDEEGQIVEHKGNTGKVLIGTAIGAAIGAAAGGAKGAAIGGGAGAATSLILVSVLAKGPSITFDAGSQFVLEASPHR